MVCLKILFASDICYKYANDETQKMTLETAQDITQELLPIFNAADFRMLNLENILYNGSEGAIKKSGPNLKCNTDFINFLKALNTNAVGLANNHYGDYGKLGMNSTLECLEQSGITHAGGGNNIEEAYRPCVFKKDGESVAVIAVCENEFSVATENTAGVAGFNLKRLADKIKEEKQKNDYVTVYFHGGNEFNPFPSPGKVDLYRLFIDLGADCVMAMHTHCPQGYEYYNGKPIVYSMGNFFFPIETREENNNWFYGYLSTVDFKKEGIELEVSPYSFFRVTDKIELLKDEAKEKFINYLNEISKPIADRKELDRLFDIWCVIYGTFYLSHLNIDIDSAIKDPSSIVRLKNALSCEAHNELVHRTAELIYSGKYEKVKECVNEIEKYQTINI